MAYLLCCAYAICGDASSFVYSTAVASVRKCPCIFGLSFLRHFDFARIWYLVLKPDICLRGDDFALCTVVAVAQVVRLTVGKNGIQNCENFFCAGSLQCEMQSLAKMVVKSKCVR